MRIAVFSTKAYDRRVLDQANQRHGHELVYFEPRLNAGTATMAHGFDGVCPFVNDEMTAPVLESLASGGVRLLTLRSAGFNHVDLRAAAAHEIVVARVPAYSPHAVAEHAAGLILTLNRKLQRHRIRDRHRPLAPGNSRGGARRQRVSDGSLSALLALAGLGGLLAL